MTDEYLKPGTHVTVRLRTERNAVKEGRIVYVDSATIGITHGRDTKRIVIIPWSVIEQVNVLAE